MVRDLAAGKRFLNLFAYTGSFSVYAAAGGAASTVTVDLSNTYLDWARETWLTTAFKARTMSSSATMPRTFCKVAAGGRRSTWPWSMPDLLEQQGPGGLLGHPAKPRRIAQSASGTDGARGDHLLLDELPPLQTGRRRDPRRDDPRDQPPDRAGRFQKPADPPLLADGHGKSSGSWCPWPFRPVPACGVAPALSPISRFMAARFV